jgi:hypothetical protein
MCEIVVPQYKIYPKHRTKSGKVGAIRAYEVHCHFLDFIFKYENDKTERKNMIRDYINIYRIT